MVLRYCANLKVIRYELTSLNRIVTDKSRRVIVAHAVYHGLCLASSAMFDMYFRIVLSASHNVSFSKRSAV